MCVTIISQGIPNVTSEQANNDPWIFIKELNRRKIKVDYICLLNEDINTSSIKSKKLLEKFKNNFKNLNSVRVINFKRKGSLKKIKYFFLEAFLYF